MTDPSLTYCCSGAENDLNPLGERRPKLPLQRKVKQLERPWKATDRQATAPHGRMWASSQHGCNKDLPRGGVRPRSGALVCRKRSESTGSSRRIRNSASASSGLSSGRRRPSTVPSPSSSGLRKPRTWGNQPFSPLSADPAWNGSDHVCWDGTGTCIRGPRGKPEKADIAAVHGHGCSPVSPGGEGNRHPELIGNDQSVRAATDATLTSAVSSPLFLATSSVTTTGAAVDVGGGEHVDTLPKASRLVDPSAGNSNNNDGDEDSCNNKSNVSLGSTDHEGLSVYVESGVAVKRPNSAGVSTARDASVHPLVLEGDKVVRPRTAGSSSQGRAVYPRSASGDTRFHERGRTPTSSRSGLEKGGCSVTSWTDETPDSVSLLECRTSVSVVLPTLEEGNGIGDKRFSSGSTKEIPTCGESETGKESAGQVESHVIDVEGVQSKVKDNPEVYTQESRERSDENSKKKTPGGQNGSTLLGTRGGHISALGYFVGDSRRPVIPSGGALHGRALVGNHHPRPSASKRSLPFPPAITPGEQPYGVAHPLSPTSMGSPPRRHRNSNWGEEGVRLAAEEKENFRHTVPFVVSGTLLGWKLSTRERKKYLENSLKNSNYSEHHLIPVYGFRRGNDDTNEGEVGGGEGSNGGGVGARSVEERRMELRRLEARALAAERTSLERRARAEGGAGGAAFARAMCRRATARAEWIQKMGEVHDVRKETVFRGSSPEELSAYRKHLRDRLHGERVRRRNARGLPPRRPPSISAVTSRADFPSACRKNNNLTTKSNNDGKRAGGDERDGGGDCGDGDGLTPDDLGLIRDELGREPYLLLVRAKNKNCQEGQATCGGGSTGAVVVGTSVPFCSECLSCCQGMCSPGGTEVVKTENRQNITKPEHKLQQSTTGNMQQQQVGGLW